MQISDLVGQYNRSVSQPEPMTGKKGVERLVSSLSELSKGNIFEGTVSSVKGGKVTLALSNGQQISARLDGKLALTAGQSMFFQVKSNNGTQVEIRPYIVDGTGGNLTLMQALKAAGLPVEAKFLSMVNKMMEENMPIDKASVAHMAKVIQDNPDINVNTLVQMDKLGLKITPEMASQFENYLEDKQAINHAMDDFIEELGELFSREEIPEQELKQMLKEVLSVVTEQQSQPEGQLQPERGIDNTSVSQEIIDIFPEAFSDGEEGIENSENLESVESLVAEEAAEGAEGAAGVAETESAAVTKTSEVAEATESGTVSDKAAAAEISENTVTEKTTSEKPSESIQARDTLQLINQLLEQNQPVDKKALITFLSGKGFKDMLRETIEQQWLIKPKDVADTDQINKLYEHIEKQITKLEQAVKATGQDTTGITNLAADIRSNVEFMNQINEAYTYVQIPLKMSGQSASGELYVYTNKKNLEDGERELSAFLHLDMEHLGSTDVSIKMYKKDVTTNFYMESDESYALVKQFLPQLEEKLKNKGYSCRFSVENQEKHINFVENFLKKDQPSAGKLHRYSFDMRA